MNTIFCNIETDKYQVLGVKSDKLVNALKQLSLPHFLALLNNWKKKAK